MGNKSSKSRLDRNELKMLVKKTGYTEETIESWYKLFIKCSDKRGVLESSDLDNMCSKFHTKLSESDNATGGLLGYLNRDNIDGVQARSIRFREFLTLLHLSAHGSEEEKLRRIFRCCDPGEGRITRADLARVLTSWTQQDMSHAKIVQRLDNYQSYTEEQFLMICAESEMKKINNNIL